MAKMGLITMGKIFRISAFLNLKINKIFMKFNRKSLNYSKPVLSGHSKINKTKVLMAIGSLMQVESIAF